MPAELKPPVEPISIQKVDSKTSMYSENEGDDADVLSLFDASDNESVMSIETIGTMPLKSEDKCLEKIMDLLEESEDNSGISRFDTWLLTEVMLQGQLFINSRYLLFNTHLPYVDSQIIKASALSKKSTALLPPMGRTVYKRYWVVLRRSCFSWFRSAKDIYFPVGTIKIEKMKNCSVIDGNKFQITTDTSTFTFRADSPNAALNWAKAIKREIFISQNQSLSGDNLFVRIPIKNVVGFFVSEALEIAYLLNLEVATKVNEHNNARRQYSFAFFGDGTLLKKVTEQLTELGIPVASNKDHHVHIEEDVLDNLVINEKNIMPIEIPKTEDLHWNILPSSPVNWNSLNLLGMLNTRLRKPRTDKFFAQDISSLANAAVAPLKVLPLLNLSNSSGRSSTSSDNELVDEESEEESESDDELDDDNAHGADLSTFLTNPKLSNLDEVNEQFRSHFGLENQTKIQHECACNLRKPNATISWSGNLVISNLYLCFQRRNIRGSNWRMVVPMKDIVHISPGSDDDGSASIDFEVTDGSYGIFKLIFGKPETRKDVEAKLKAAVNSQLANAERKKVSKTRLEKLTQSSSENRFLEYATLSARTSASTPKLSSRLGSLVPPMVFDRKFAGLKLDSLEKPFKSMKIAMMMIGSRGDVQPYIALSQGLMEEGHKCVIITHKEFQPWVESFGIEFREVGEDPSKLMELMVCYGSISYSFMRDALANFKQWVKNLMHESWDALKDLEADVLIESPSSMIGIHIAEALNIPYFRAFTMPWTRTKTYPQALIQPDSKYSGNYNYLTYVMYDHMVWFGISKMVNHWRKHHLDLPPTDLDLMDQDEVPFLYCVSPTVLVPPLDQPDWVHTCGYWELKPQDQDKDKEEKDVDQELVKFIKSAKDQNKPLVYVGFGSIIVSDPEAMTNTIVDATKEADVYCVLARGWSARSTKKPTDKVKDETPINASHIYEVDSVSHQWLFPQMDVCVHHGGSGTTGTSLRYGIPTIIKPFFGDQYFYARRVEDLHVGVHLKRLTKSGLVSAIRTCIDDEKLVRQAHTVGEQISHEHGVSAGILYLYQELSYARDVTEHRRKQTLDAANNGYLNSIPFKSYTSKISPFASLRAPKLSSILPSLPRIGQREKEAQEKAQGEVDVSI